MPEYTREDMLSGEFGNINQGAPELVSPDQGEKISRYSTKLVWSEKKGASIYYIEVAEDTNFQLPINGSPFSSNEPNINITFPDAKSYYWRVRSNITSSGKYSEIRTIHIIGDAIRVFCPSNSIECTNEGKIGNKSSPYQLINPSQSEAKTFGIEVHVASRGGSSYYEEVLFLVPGVTIKGGYSSADWSRNIASYKTEIRNEASRVVMGYRLNESNSFSMDGFTITSTSTELLNETIYLEDVSNSFTLSNNTINGGIGQDELLGRNYALLLKNSSPILSNNSIITGGSGSLAQSYGISIKGDSSTTINENTISGGLGNQTFSISIQNNSNPNISKNTINGGEASGALSGTYSIFVADTSAPHISENTINGGNGSNSYGIYSKSSSQFTISQNTISGGTGDNKNYGIYITDSATIQLNYNTINAGGHTSSISYGIYNNVNNNTVIQNNTIHGEGLGNASYGIYINDSDITVKSNSIHGGNTSGSGSTSYGIYNANSSNTKLYNNIIFGGDGDNSSFSIYCDASSPDVINNTIHGGLGSNNYGIYMTASSNPAIENNILFHSGVGVDAYSVYEADVASDASTLKNNNFFRVNTGGHVFYYEFDNFCSNNNDGDADSHTCGLLDFVDISLVSGNPSGNTDIDNVPQIFIDMKGPDGDISTMDDNNWHLNPSLNCPPGYGGLDHSSLFTSDLDGTTRTSVIEISCIASNDGASGWSMGAYERE